MATFGKLTDYFNRRKSREELHVGRSSRRSGSYCCTVAEARSLERKLQRPTLAKSRTLPSIPQSPRVSRVHRSDLVGGSPPRRKNPPAAGGPKARTLPPAGELWRLEDDNMEGEDEAEPGGARPRSQSPFSHLRARAAYLRKSVSADNHLDLNGDDSSGTAAEDKPARGSKAKLKRKFSLGSVDRKENAHKKSESGISKFTHRLSLKERPAKAEKTASEGAHSYRRRSLSVDWADSCKMTRPMRGEQGQQPTPARKSASLSSPSAARRLYRNLSGKFRVSTNPSSSSSAAAAASEDGAPSEQEGDKERLRKSTVLQSNEALFEAVEHQQSDLVQLLLSQYSLEELDLNTPNSEGLLPLDIAVMTNDAPVAKLLLRAGAKESPHFVSSAGRALHLATLAQEAEQRVSELRSQVRGAGPGELEAAERERERQLKAWEWRLRLFRRMLTGFRHAKLPDTPGAARLSVGGSSSLTLDFQEPRCVDSAVVTKYKVSWSTTPSFSSVLGEAVLEDTAALRYDITGLTSGTRYFVRVSAYNMKGWGPALASTPASAAPSSWRDLDGRAPRQRGLKEVLDRLLAQIKDGHQNCVCHEQCRAPAQGRKHSVSKSLRHLFQPNSKFVKSLKRGLYLTSILYRDDSVLVTPEDQIPIVEVEDSCPSSLMQDFLWFTKVSYLWEEIPWMQQRLNPAHAACSCTLQTRLKMLQAVAHLQGALGTQDLGQVYFEPIKDKHGNALLVLLKDMNASPNPDGARWMRLCKLQLQRKSVSSPEEPGALDALLVTLHEKLAYHRRSRKLLAPGLYLGYLKLCTSVEQIRALVPQKLPNVLCHTKIRDNHNVSREEWQWLQALGSPMETEGGAQSGPPPLLRDLRSAIEDLTAHIDVPGNQAQGFRIYTQEVLEFGDEVSFLLLLPPCDDVCTVPGQNNPYSPRRGFLALPLQMFELVHFAAYRPAFIGRYCRVSALLELESLLSQQALREAFSQDELAAAKRQQRRLQEHLQQTEEVWRDARWIAEALQHARDKQPTGAVSVGGLMDSSEEGTPACASRRPDVTPSPLPSPEPCRKHSDFAGLSDEEGSSEVFLTTDSDYDSSRAQSPRE
ncbi:ankyrin repeat and fibronectin type-III domain-containing protein 1, partial [Hippocampus comes]|uniref:ankyrin repeat and fibronectin type-III domain-containing protein 1 n=1 Tax=Hippocampus comes TaxID=109280 RepID=UPI00094E04C3